jgi:hypothetical protein
MALLLSLEFRLFKYVVSESVFLACHKSSLLGSGPVHNELHHECVNILTFARPTTPQGLKSSCVVYVSWYMPHISAALERMANVKLKNLLLSSTYTTDFCKGHLKRL